MPAPRDETLLRRDLRAIAADGIAFSVMVGMGESYLSAFALAIGKSEAFAGLLAAVPMVAGAILQLVTPHAVRRLGSYRRWVVGCAVVQALTFVPLVAAALHGSLASGLLLAIAAVYWASGMSTGPAWNTWIGGLVPKGIRANYFARRTRWTHLAVVVGLLVGGSILHLTKARGDATLGFAALFFIAGAARLISAGFLARQSEPERTRAAARSAETRSLTAGLRLAAERRLIAYLVAMQFAVQVSGPYFTPYMLRQLELPYAKYMVLVATSFAAKMLVLPLLGQLASRIGPRRLLFIGAAAIIPLPSFWLVSDSFAYLLGLQAVAGSVWAIHELAVMLAIFETIPEEERTSVLTVHNLGHAAAVLCGALVGGILLRRLGEDAAAYRAVFAASTGMRLAAISLVAAIPALKLVRGWRMPLATRPIAIRPGMGSMERPILPALDDDETDTAPT